MNVTFIFSDHAKQRMLERAIPDPHAQNLTLVKNKLRQLLIANCPKNRYKLNHIYYRQNIQSKKIAVYVCVCEDVAVFKVVTVFWLFREPKQSKHPTQTK
jgi:hypothetical protein